MSNRLNTTLQTIFLSSILLSGCRTSPRNPEPNAANSMSTAGPREEVIYDCAANALYALSRKASLPISYQECLDLLPFSPHGNSMLEFKAALLFLGFHVEAQRLLVAELSHVQVPSVVLILWPDADFPPPSAPMGHYLTLWPLNGNKTEILNYPHESATVSGDDLVEQLRAAGIKSVPTLLCGEPGQTLQEMLVPSDDIHNPTPAAKNVHNETTNALKDANQ